MFSCCYYAIARRSSFETERVRYISDILRITNGIMPVLWVSPEYSFESTAKYFDLSGNENHALQGTADYRPAFVPPGLYFDGSNDYLGCGNDTTLNSVESAELWVKLSDISSDQIMFSKEDDWSTIRGWQVVFDDVSGGYTDIFVFRGNSVVVQATESHTAGVWYHIVGVYDGSDSKIYVNGIEKGSESGNFFGYSTSDHVTIGALYLGSYYFNGILDEIRIYNTALSTAQIQALYLAGLPKHRQ